MSYETFRVEITRDEGAVTIELTAYFDRLPETDVPTRGMLTRAAKGVWNSRLQFTGDFATLGEALAASVKGIARRRGDLSRKSRATLAEMVSAIRDDHRRLWARRSRR